MHSTDERREVAERLQKAVKEHQYSSSDLGESIAAEVNCYGYPREKVFTHLADLIDPTCHLLPSLDGGFGCDRCFTWFPDMKKKSRYCPECGARVVSGDGE